MSPIYSKVNHAVIYARLHESYLKDNLCKIGKTTNLAGRDVTYATGEYRRGKFIAAYAMPPVYLDIVDQILKVALADYNRQLDGGTEFFTMDALQHIETIFINIGLTYYKLTADEIVDLLNASTKPTIHELLEDFRTIQKDCGIPVMKAILSTNDLLKPIPELVTEAATVAASSTMTVVEPQETTIIPREYQKTVLDKIDAFYAENAIGKIVWACGLGKALLSILITRQLKATTVVIGVPSNNLQKQFIREILKVFPNKNNILMVGSAADDSTDSTTNKATIFGFLNSGASTTSTPRFIVTTYHSCHLLMAENTMFDFKVGDEAHHLVGQETDDTRGFRLFHKIPAAKTLYMTATEKFIEQSQTASTSASAKYSMDDVDIFGECIDCKTVNWAIENKKITDYNILVLKNTIDEVEQIISALHLSVDNKDIFMACYMGLKSIEKYPGLTHMLLYANVVEDTILAQKYIADLLDLKIVSIPADKIYNRALYSKNCPDLGAEVAQFCTMPYGIISCVYMFGEGFDLPKLNGVCIAGNMRSETRIAQYVLRPNRLDPMAPDKKAFVIVPYIDSEWESDTRCFDKVRAVIAQLRNVDANVEQRIKVAVSRRNDDDRSHSAAVSPDDVSAVITHPHDVMADYTFIENVDELERLKIHLRRSKTLASDFTAEQDEYNAARADNRHLGITSCAEYRISRDNRRTGDFIDSPETYFKAKGVWGGWYDFMGCDTSKFIQTKEAWINYCNEKNIRSLEDYWAACEVYDVLPKEPAEFYSAFSNILLELGRGVLPSFRRVGG